MFYDRIYLANTVGRAHKFYVPGGDLLKNSETACLILEKVCFLKAMLRE